MPFPSHLVGAAFSRENRTGDGLGGPLSFAPSRETRFSICPSSPLKLRGDRGGLCAFAAAGACLKWGSF